MTISLDKINPNLLKAISIKAEKENKTETEVLEDVIERGLEDKNNKIPNYLIGNKDTYNPDFKRRRRFAGIGSSDKPFNAVKLVREVRRGNYDIPWC